jgi:hypothetical protein
MTQKVTVKTGFKTLTDTQAIATTDGVIKGPIYTDKSAFVTPPVDQQALQTAIMKFT